jgi:lysophospholipase L1-like esterase
LFRSPLWIGIFALLAAGLALFALAMLREAWIARKVQALSGAGPLRPACAAPPATGGGPRLFMIGDSTLARWPPDLIASHWNAVNCGHGGETTAQLARRIGDFGFLRPGDTVLIVAGVNDLVAAGFIDPAGAEKAVSEVSQRLAAMAQAAKAKGARVVLGTLVPPSSPNLLRLPVWKETVRDFAERVNADIRVAGREQKIGLVDFAAALESHDRRTPDAFRTDTLHLNATGYQRLAKALNEVLER